MTFQQFVEAGSTLAGYEQFEVTPIRGAFEVTIAYQGMVNTFQISRSDDIADALNCRELFTRLKQAETRLITKGAH